MCSSQIAISDLSLFLFFISKLVLSVMGACRNHKSKSWRFCESHHCCLQHRNGDEWVAHDIFPMVVHLRYGGRVDLNTGNGRMREG
ncbi:hypothetical protein AAZX31_16G041500 [Glycine max]|nr:hypothetical protein GLYMA_16G044166v4 [Glycine max]KAH1149946.1 hypothetical protein GYH30_044122 [Glycine max]